MIRTRAAKTNTAKWYNSGSAIVNRTIPTLYHDFVGQRYYDSALGETAFPYTSVHRASNAMQFDVNGNLIWGPAQMCTHGQDFSTTWSMGADGAAVLSGNTSPTGAPSYTITWTTASPTSGCAITSQPAVVGANMTYSVYLRYVNHRWARVYMYSNAVASNGVIVFVDLQNKALGNSGLSGTGTSFVSSSITDVGGGWVRVSVSGNPNATTSSDIGLLVATAADNGVSTRVGNGAAIEAASALLEMHSAVTPSTWQPQFATTGSAWYGPRFDCDPFTKEKLGLLVEQSRSNDISRTFLLDSTTGTFQDGTGSNGPTYLGGWSSARYTGNSVSAPHFYFGGPVTPGASTSRSVSAIVAYVDTQYLQLATSANWALDAANTYMNIDAIAGTITASGSAITDTFIKKLANNVYHIGFTCVSSAAPTGGAGCIVVAINTSTAGRLPIFTHTGSFDVIYLFNGAGVGWNSVTPTFGTAATRANDVATMPTGSWFNQEQSVIYMETVPTSSMGTAKRAISINDGTSNNALSLIKSGSSLAQIRTVIGGVSSFSPTTANAVVDFQNTKFAALLNSPTKKMVLNGGAVASSSVAFPTSGYTTLNTGSEPSSTGYWGGWIKQIRYYNTASPSDAQLQTLTT